MPRPADCMSETVWAAAVCESQTTALAPKWRWSTVRTVCTAFTVRLALCARPTTAKIRPTSSDKLHRAGGHSDKHRWENEEEFMADIREKRQLRGPWALANKFKNEPAAKNLTPKVPQSSLWGHSPICPGRKSTEAEGDQLPRVKTWHLRLIHRQGPGQWDRHWGKRDRTDFTFPVSGFPYPLSMSGRAGSRRRIRRSHHRRWAHRSHWRRTRCPRCRRWT